MENKRLEKTERLIRSRFPEAPMEAVRMFAEALADCRQQIRRQSRRKPLRGKEIKELLNISK